MSLIGILASFRYKIEKSHCKPGRIGILNRMNMNELANETLWAVPFRKDNQWGFTFLAAKGSRAPSEGTWMDRNAAIEWARESDEPTTASVLIWQQLFLRVMTEGVMIPAIDHKTGAVMARWRLYQIEDTLDQFVTNTRLAAFDTMSHEEQIFIIRAFLDDWADEFARGIVKKISLPKVIGGSLGRRFIGRLTGPRGWWEIDPSEARALVTLCATWVNDAQHFVQAQEGSTADRARVRIFNEGDRLGAEVITPHPFVIWQWSERFGAWSRALGAGGTSHPLYFNEEETNILLQKELPTLMSQGVTIEFPKAWTRSSLRARGYLPDDNRTPDSPLGDRLRIDWNLSLDGNALTPEELKVLAQSKEGLVKFGSQWVVMNATLIAQARSLYDRVRKKRVSTAEILRLKLDEEEGRMDLEATPWLARILDSLKVAETTEIDLSTFNGVLRPYQVEGVTWLLQRMTLGLGSLLADDMGLGKTVEVIAALATLKSQHKLNSPVMLVCPLSVAGNWEQEWRRFCPDMTVGSHLGSQRTGALGFEEWVGKHDIVLTTYDVLARDADMFKEIHWEGIVVDEAQHIKNHRTKRARSLRYLESLWRVALTGTPIENRLMDLWAQMDFLLAGYLGSETDFREDFERPITRLHEAAPLNRLKRLTDPFVLRRVKTDPLILPDLPEKIEVKEWIGLTAEQAGLYQAIVNRFMDAIDSLKERQQFWSRRGLILSALTQLKQVVNHPASYQTGGVIKGRSGKLNRLEELMEDILSRNERVVLFSQYVRMGALLESYLARHFKIPVLFLHGGLPKAERDAVIAKFQDEKGPPLLIASLKAGGVGLNLVQAQHVIHYDRWWNPAVEDQATDRVWRIGQQSVVTVHKFITRGTLEERIDALIESKRVLSHSVIAQSSDQWIMDMNDDEIRQLIQLEEGIWTGSES